MTKIAAAALLATTAVFTGCVAVIPYEPKTDLVSELGPDTAAARLNEVMVRAVAPKIVSAKVEGRVLTYEANTVVVGPWWSHSAVTGKRAISLASVSKTEVYDNGKLFVYEGNVATHQIGFATVDDAKAAADLILSFKSSSSG